MNGLHTTAATLGQTNTPSHPEEAEDATWKEPGPAV